MIDIRQTADRELDCVVCGSCTVDILVHPVNLHEPIGTGQLHRVDPIGLSVGGIVSNAGITLSRLGLRPAAFSAVGKDQWGDLVCQAYREAEIDAAHLIHHASMPTSVTAVMIDADGERSFVHSQGAPKAMNREDYFAALPLFAKSRAMLLGYYPLLPNMLDDLADVFKAIRSTGCLTALDAAGGGGTMQPLQHVLPHVDLYCPSFDEARNQTGLDSPEAILNTYRDCGATGWLGVKLGDRGALLSPATGEFVTIEPVQAPSPVVDTTGAGDVFFAALLSAILRGCDAEKAGHIAATAGAISVTKPGATTAAMDWKSVAPK